MYYVRFRQGIRTWMVRGWPQRLDARCKQSPRDPFDQALDVDVVA